MRHDFLAITTMGVSFLFTGIIRKQDMLGGEMGVSGIPLMVAVGLLLMALSLTILFIIMIYVKRSWMGFVFDSISEMRIRQVY